jgi:serine/threonine protein kinase
MSNRQALTSGSILGGDVVIKSVLGSGGFGITYLGRDQQRDVDVAIKEYFPVALAYRENESTVRTASSTPEASADYKWGLERFLLEAQTLAKLDHPNIVRVDRFFKANNTAYMVLEFVEGRDLESWLKQLGRPPTQQELDGIVMPLLDALKVVHDADIVHRDVKPQNIYVKARSGTPILLDFGAARQALGQHTRATAAFVSPGYSPPESYDNDPSEQGPWTDIYGLAATVARCLTGKPPSQVMTRMVNDPYTSLAASLENAADYRPGFLQAIDNGMRIRRQERPQDVMQWRAQLLTEASAAPSDDNDTVVRQPKDEAGSETELKPKGKGTWSAVKIAQVVAAVVIGVLAIHQIYLSINRLGEIASQGGGGSRPPDSDSSTGNNVTNHKGPTTVASNKRQKAPVAPPQRPPSTGAQQQKLKTYRNARFGFQVGYPSKIVSLSSPPANGGGQAFQSADQSFQIVTHARFNVDNETADALRRELTSSDARFRNANVVNSGKDGFTLSAQQNGRRLFHKAVLSCGNQIINVLELNYLTTGQRSSTYRALAGRVATSFKPGRGADLPADGCGKQSVVSNQPWNLAHALSNSPAIPRLVQYGWSENGIQKGLWTGHISGSSNTELIIRCSIGNVAQRIGEFELRAAENVNFGVVGVHNVVLQVGTYTDTAPFQFSLQNGRSVGTFRIVETKETKDHVLNVLRLFVNNSNRAAVLMIAGTQGSESFNLSAFQSALGPCLGAPIKQQWRNLRKRDGVVSATVRNGDGGVFIVRCDTTPATRGSAIIGFAGRRNSSRQIAGLSDVRVRIGSHSSTFRLLAKTEPNVFSGAMLLSRSAIQDGSFKQFLSLLQSGQSMQIENRAFGVSETFDLANSRTALSDCAALY